MYFKFLLILLLLVTIERWEFILVAIVFYFKVYNKLNTIYLVLY